MWNIQIFAELPSTQTLARERLSSGKAKHGDVIVALHQTGGKGRYENRIWHDEAGANLLMTIILTEIPAPFADKMQFITALSVLAAIRSLLGNEIRAFAPERVRLKWTNDILIDGKKISGVLSEAIWSGSTMKGAAIGIGININQDHFSGPLAYHAISLKHILQYSIPLQRARDVVLAALEYTLAHYSSTAILVDDIRTELEWMYGIEYLSLTEPDGTKAEGLRYDGITDDGALRTIAPDGSLHIYQNATLHFA